PTSRRPSSRSPSAESRPRNTAFCSDVGSRRTTESRTRVTDTKGTGSLPSACHVPPALSSVMVMRDGGDAGKRTSPSQRPATEWAARSACRRPHRSEEHTSELQSRRDLVCRLLLEKKKNMERDYTASVGHAHPE